METRKARIIASSAGGTAGKNAVTYKISLPTSWINQMGLNFNERDVEIIFDNGTILIRKKQTVDSFLNFHKGSLLKKYSYYCGDLLCTVIYADYTDRVVFAENYTDNPVKTAFGCNAYPTWQDFCDFIEERCVPKGRSGLREYLEAIGVQEYDPFEIIAKTEGRMAEDKQWLKVEDI